jgi:hypothetical protein
VLVASVGLVRRCHRSPPARQPSPAAPGRLARPPQHDLAQHRQPSLFINRRTAPRLIPVSRSFAWDQTGLAARNLRDRHIIDEVLATGGDVRRLCQLFDIGVEAAIRYTGILDTSDPTNSTHGPT